MQHLAVVAAPLAVVGGDDDPRHASPGHRLERGEQPAQVVVHRRDLTLVGVRRKPAAERLRWRVGLVRVVVVHPEEARPGAGRREPGEGAVGRLPGAAFGLPTAELVVVEVEAPAQAEWTLERESRDEGGRGEAELVQALGDERDAIGKMTPVFVDAVLPHVEPREHRGVRRQRRRRGCVGLGETHAARDERGECWGRRGIHLGGQRVRPGRIERDEEERRAYWRRRDSFGLSSAADRSRQHPGHDDSTHQRAAMDHEAWECSRP